MDLALFNSRFVLNLSPLKGNAKVAQLVEHDLAKVGVAGSNPVFRSKADRNDRLFY